MRSVRIVELFQLKDFSVLDPMDAFMNNRVVDAAEVPKEVHQRIDHYSLRGNAHLDGFAFVGVKHLRVRFREVYLTENRGVFPDTLCTDGELQPISKNYRVDSDRRLTMRRDLQCLWVIFMQECFCFSFQPLIGDIRDECI